MVFQWVNLNIFLKKSRTKHLNPVKSLAMERNWLKGAKPAYDVVVIGSGLAGMTAANLLAKLGHSVLLAEHHYNMGGLATWFKRKGGHILDISLHGFPSGMVKTFRKYWTQEMADSVVRLEGIRFDNPQFQLTTTFDKTDFTKILIERFGIVKEVIDEFFSITRNMNFYDELKMTTRELFEKFFPERGDVWRFLMEPITYANGSTLDDPALSYGIVFSNFMDKGVFTYQGGTDDLIKKMKKELIKNGVDIRTHCLVEKIHTEGKKVTGVKINGKDIQTQSVLSNSNILNTVHNLVGDENFNPEFIKEVERSHQPEVKKTIVYKATQPSSWFAKDDEFVVVVSTRHHKDHHMVWKAGCQTHM